MCSRNCTGNNQMAKYNSEVFLIEVTLLKGELVQSNNFFKSERNFHCRCTSFARPSEKLKYLNRNACKTIIEFISRCCGRVTQAHINNFYQMMKISDYVLIAKTYNQDCEPKLTELYSKQVFWQRSQIKGRKKIPNPNRSRYSETQAQSTV